MDTLFEISQRINELMLDNDVLVKDIAKELGVHVLTVKTWLKCTSYIRLTDLVKLADFFNVTLDFILGRSDNQLDYKPKQIVNVYQQIRQVLREKGITVYRMQKDIAIKDSYLAKWKKGQNTHILSLIRMADYLGVSVDYLVGRDG